MSWKMYLAMIASLTVMLSVLFIVAWSALGNAAWHYRQSREIRIPEESSEMNPGTVRWKLPLWKAVPLALAAAWLVVHFIVQK